MQLFCVCYSSYASPLFSKKTIKPFFLRTKIFYKPTVVKALKETEVYDIITQVYIWANISFKQSLRQPMLFYAIFIIQKKSSFVPILFAKSIGWILIKIKIFFKKYRKKYRIFTNSISRTVKLRGNTRKRLKSLKSFAEYMTRFSHMQQTRFIF